jgi:hypothetical protein
VSAADVPFGSLLQALLYGSAADIFRIRLSGFPAKLLWLSLQEFVNIFF